MSYDKRKGEVFYLFGWKQEFNRVRGIPRTCHFWQSHDAEACAPGERNNSVVISREAHSETRPFSPSDYCATADSGSDPPKQKLLYIYETE